jgi:hypothetical protein
MLTPIEHCGRADPYAGLVTFTGYTQAPPPPACGLLHLLVLSQCLPHPAKAPSSPPLLTAWSQVSLFLWSDTPSTRPPPKLKSPPSASYFHEAFAGSAVLTLEKTKPRVGDNAEAQLEAGGGGGDPTGLSSVRSQITCGGEVAGEGKT